MNRYNNTFRAVVAGCALAVVASGCSGAAPQGTGNSDRFPEAEFPPATYGNLSGSVAWYDSSGGTVTTVRDETVWKDFTELTGVTTAADFSGEATKFFSSAEAGQVPWSLVEFATVSDYQRAAAAGLLAPLDTTKVPVDTLTEGTFDEHGVRIARYGIGLAYNADKWPDSGDHPTSTTDIFDTARFPGKRCFYQYPQFGGTLETALLADGVDPAQLYPLDVDRAFAKLDSIKSDIVWWSDAETGIRLLTTGECDLAMLWSGRAAAAKNNGNNVGYAWGDALYADGVLAVPKDAPNPDAGQAMLAMYIQDLQGQIEFVDRTGYATQIKSLTLDDYDAAIRPFIPAGPNLDNAIAEDVDYYSENITSLLDRFNAWVVR